MKLIMAKNVITADVIEAILVKVTEKFTESINVMMDRFGKIFSDVIRHKVGCY